MRAAPGARPRARARPGSRRPEAPGLTTAAALALAAWAGLLLLAPPASNYFWGVNGLRSVAPAAALALLLGAAVAGAAARLELRRIEVAWAIALGLAALIAHPLREKIHLLGDTQLRLHALFAAGGGMLPAVFGSWWARLHANPLDIAVEILGVLSLQRLGLSLFQAVAMISFALVLAYGAGCWRLAGRLGAAPALRLALALALAMTGTLEAFAGYAEAAGVVAVAAVWWWAEMLAPLEGAAQAWRVAAAFMALVLAHRVGLVMLLPLLWRSLGPAASADRPAGRRALLGLTAAAVIVVAVVSLASGAGRQLAADARDLLRAARGFEAHPSDIANSLALVAPLAVLAPVLSGRVGWVAWLREPAFQWIAAGAAPLLVALAWLFTVGESGLGAHRDWDANVLLGVTLTAGAGALLARLPAARLRTTLTAALPLLVVGAMGWVAVNADAHAAARRALALATEPPPLTRPQLAHLHAYFGQRAMDERRPDLGGREYEQAFDLGGNPRRALLATEAWLVSGNLLAARRTLALARSRGALSPELEASARQLEALIERAEEDSAAAGSRR